MPLGGSWTSQPSLVRHADGHLEVFAVGDDGNIYRRHQLGPSQPFVDSWTMMSSHLQVFLYGEDLSFDPLTARIGYLVDGAARTTVFARTTRGRTVYAYSVPGGWSDWHSLAAAQDGDPVIGNPVGLRIPDGPSLTGGPTVFSRDRWGALRRKVRGAGPEDWGNPADWENLGGVLASDAAAAQGTSDPAHEISTSLFVRGTDAGLWWTGETVAVRGSLNQVRPYDGWHTARVARFHGSALSGRPVAPSPQNVIWRGVNDSLWTASVDSAGDFTGITDLHVQICGDPGVAVGRAGNGAGIFARNADGQIVFRSSHGIAVAWSGQPAIGDPVAQTSADGRAEAVFVASDAQLYHLWETAPGSNTFSEGS